MGSGERYGNSANRLWRGQALRFSGSGLWLDTYVELIPLLSTWAHTTYLCSSSIYDRLDISREFQFPILSFFSFHKSSPCNIEDFEYSACYEEAFRQKHTWVTILLAFPTFQSLSPFLSLTNVISQLKGEIRRLVYNGSRRMEPRMGGRARVESHGWNMTGEKIAILAGARPWGWTPVATGCLYPTTWHRLSRFRVFLVKMRRVWPEPCIFLFRYLNNSKSIQIENSIIYILFKRPQGVQFFFNLIYIRQLLRKILRFLTGMICRRQR